MTDLASLTPEQVQFVSTEFATALVKTAPSDHCTTGDDSGRRAAVWQNTRQARDRLSVAVQNLPPAGTPAPC